MFIFVVLALLLPPDPGPKLVDPKGGVSPATAPAPPMAPLLILPLLNHGTPAVIFYQPIN
jgi:hypothetical protein